MEKNQTLQLLRGDTWRKGSDLSLANNIDYAKNVGGFYFFSDSFKEAEIYARSVMNDQIRVNHGAPNITEIEAKDVNLLDLTPLGLSFNAVAVFTFLQEKLFNGELDFENYLLLMGFAREYNDEGELIKLNASSLARYKEQYDELINGDSVEYCLTHTDFSNGTKGVFFSDLLTKNGYDGYKFKDNVGFGYHYGFINSDKLKITKQYDLELIPVKTVYNTELMCEEVRRFSDDRKITGNYNGEVRSLICNNWSAIDDAFNCASDGECLAYKSITEAKQYYIDRLFNSDFN